MVLSDVSMPGLSGWNVASDCRALFLHCPVGLVIGWGDQLDPELVASSGVAFALAKPIRGRGGRPLGHHRPPGPRRIILTRRGLKKIKTST